MNNIALTKSQLAISQMVSRDHTVAQIANVVGVSKSTIRNHLAGARMACGIQTTPGLIGLLLRNELIR